MFIKIIFDMSCKVSIFILFNINMISYSSVSSHIDNLIISASYVYSLLSKLQEMITLPASSLSLLLVNLILKIIIMAIIMTIMVIMMSAPICNILIIIPANFSVLLTFFAKIEFTSLARSLSMFTIKLFR